MSQQAPLESEYALEIYPRRGLSIVRGRAPAFGLTMVKNI